MAGEDSLGFPFNLLCSPPFKFSQSAPVGRNGQNACLRPCCAPACLWTLFSVRRGETLGGAGTWGGKCCCARPGLKGSISTWAEL